MSILKRLKDLTLHFAALLKVPKKSLLKLPQGYFSHKQVGSKLSFEQHLFLKNRDIAAVRQLMTFLACSNTYPVTLLSSSFA